jgi:hypothetical protein
MTLGVMESGLTAGSARERGGAVRRASRRSGRKERAGIAKTNQTAISIN